MRAHICVDTPVNQCSNMLSLVKGWYTDRVTLNILYIRYLAAYATSDVLPIISSQINLIINVLQTTSTRLWLQCACTVFNVLTVWFVAICGVFFSRGGRKLKS